MFFILVSKSSEAERRRKVSAPLQQHTTGVAAASGGRDGVGGVGGSHQGGATTTMTSTGHHHTVGASDLFRPRAGSDSRAPGVLGKMASMTRTRWRSGEGQALQPGVSLRLMNNDMDGQMDGQTHPLKENAYANFPIDACTLQLHLII